MQATELKGCKEKMDKGYERAAVPLYTTITILISQNKNKKELLCVPHRHERIL